MAVPPHAPVAERFRPAQLFISYAHADEAHRERLVAHLAPLQREGLIAPWHDRQILPGSEWEATIDQHLAAADIVLLLVSADFVASDYCYQRELAMALERHERGETRVIPLIVAPVDFGRTPFAKFQALPRDAKPVSTWSNPDEAWLDVARGIRQVLESRGAAPAAAQGHPRGPPSWAKLSVVVGLGVLGSVFLAPRILTERPHEKPPAAMTAEARTSEGPPEPVPVEPVPPEPMKVEAREAGSKPSRPRRAQQDAPPRERQLLSYRAGTPDEFKSLVAAALEDSRTERHDLPCPVELRVIPASATMTVYGRCLCPRGATTETAIATVSSRGGMMPGNIGAKVVSGLKDQDWKACP